MVGLLRVKAVFLVFSALVVCAGRASAEPLFTSTDPVLTGDMVNNFSRETWRGDNVSMPWEETHAMDQRMKFLLEWKAGLKSKTELYRRYGIPRRIGYKWVERYLRDGPPAGLGDRSRAPLHHPRQIAPERVAGINCSLCRG